MNNKWRRRRPFMILLVPAIFTAVSGATMLLWNNIMPSVFHLGMINFWQAAGLLLLSKILFGFRRGGGRFGGGMWRRRMMMKWKGMSEEERQRFTERMGCGGRGNWGQPEQAV